ncbi:MAG: pilus assembly protein TadG-related protein [Chloroflexota bacterium]|nr:pilus assembly protein TadG-related protein [Chloroflexota bacterium]
MSRRRSIVRAAGDTRGAVLVFVALTLPALIGVGGLVVDVGNWFAHKRHLQVQADAGALAGAGKFRVPCDSSKIVYEAAKYSSVEYSGPGYSPGPGYNPQIQATPPERLHRMINSKLFYDQSSPVDDTVVEGPPCDAKMIDVKLTETDLPWFLKVAQVKYINAHARVEIRQKTTSVGALPIGVPEVGPQKAKAIYVDEATGAVVASTDLKRTGTNNGLAIWSNIDALPVERLVTVNSAKIGVRIVLSGSSSTNCGDPLVNCYGAGTNNAIVAGTAGLVHVRGWSSTSGTASDPQVGDAQLFGAGCEDGYFTATAGSYPCTVNVGAVVDFGGAAIDTVRVLAKKTGANNNTTVPLAPPTSAGGQWTGGGISIGAATGPTSIDLLWQTGCDVDRTKACNQAKTSLGTVQRTFSGDESLAVSGPIKLLRLSEGGVPGANSFERCAVCTHDLVVTLGLKPSLQNAQNESDPIVSLKVAGGGSQNQGLDCDPEQPNIRDELAYGCGPTYTVNDGQSSCLTATPLWASPQPWNCVVINTGATVGQVTQGMNLRILGDTNASTCTAPNNWASFDEGLPPGDPRIVDVFLTPFGAFTGSGGATVPVTGFATFYVTGWHNGGCQGQGDDPAGQGAIVGHYIKYIDTLNNGGGGEELCDFDSLGSCVAVFTR